MRSRQPEERQTAEETLPRLALNLAFSDVVDFVIEMKIVNVDRVECIAGNVDELHGRRIPGEVRERNLSSIENLLWTPGSAQPLR